MSESFTTIATSSRKKARTKFLFARAGDGLGEGKEEAKKERKKQKRSKERKKEKQPGGGKK